MAKCNQQERRPNESHKNWSEIIMVQKNPFSRCVSIACSSGGKRWMQINSMICAVIRFRNDESSWFEISAAVIVLLYEIGFEFFSHFFNLKLNEDLHVNSMWLSSAVAFCSLIRWLIRICSNVSSGFDQWESGSKNAILISSFRRVF